MAIVNGGARPGAGRPPGMPNKATRELRKLAQEYGPDALVRIAEMAGLIVDKHGQRKGQADSEQARITALGMLLDRGYGKSAQPHTGEDGEGPVDVRTTIIRQVIVDPKEPNAA